MDKTEESLLRQNRQVGNFWLTVSQWFIAAEQPPHLAAIAPWESFYDHFEEPGTRGGIPEPSFPEVIIKTFAPNTFPLVEIDQICQTSIPLRS